MMVQATPMVGRGNRGRMSPNPSKGRGSADAEAGTKTQEGGNIADAMSKLITYLVDKDKTSEGPQAVKPATSRFRCYQSPATQPPSTWQTGSR